MDTENNQNQKAPEIDLLYIIAICFRYRVGIFVSTTVIAVLSVVYVLAITPVYASTVKMYGAIKGTSGPVNELIASLGLTTKTTSLYIPDIVGSRDVAKRVVSRKYYVNGDSITLIQFWKLDKSGMSEESKWDKAIKRYNGIVKMKKDNETELLILTTELPNKDLPSQVAMAVTEETTSFLQEIYKKTFVKARIYAEARIKESEKEIAVLEKGLTDFMNNNQVLTSPSLKMELVKRRSEYGLLESVVSMLKKQRELILVEEIKDRPVVYLIQNPSKHERPIRPQKRKVVIFYTLIGFIFSCITAIMKVRYITTEKINNFKTRIKTL